MIAHVIDVLNAIDLSRIVVVGHSMGGALAAHLSLLVPERVRGVVLVAPIGFGIARAPEIGRALSPQWTIPFSRKLLRRSVLAAGLRRLYCAKALVDQRNVDEYWAPSQFDGFVPAMRALLHGFRWTGFTAEEMSRISVPGLIVRGGRDPVVARPRTPVPLPAGWRELVIANAGHLPHDEAPEAVNGAIAEFLGSLPRD